jgi:hypothetical protein
MASSWPAACWMLRDAVAQWAALCEAFAAVEPGSR